MLEDSVKDAIRNYVRTDLIKGDKKSIQWKTFDWDVVITEDQYLEIIKEIFINRKMFQTRTDMIYKIMNLSWYISLADMYNDWIDNTKQERSNDPLEIVNMCYYIYAFDFGNANNVMAEIAWFNPN
jgi:UDP-2,3-diacylglucosamine pyrophosphatase LpxH